MKREKLNKQIIVLFLQIFASISVAQTNNVTQEEMQKIYQEVKTPFKYGLVITPSASDYMVDCPSIFRYSNTWYMTYLVFDGHGYETWLAQSEDLLNWKTLWKVLPFGENSWDSDQRGGFPALQDMEWGGTYALNTYDGYYFMTYMGNNKSGYEAQPLSIGLAYIDSCNVNKDLPWTVSNTPILSSMDDEVQWFEKVTQYKSIIYEDKRNTLNARFFMFYNALGINPENNIKAERIGMALSDDLKTWKRYEHNPIFSNEEKGTITGDAHLQTMGDIYVMFYYRAFDPAKSYKAYNTFACSRDLINWTKWEGEPLIRPSRDYDSRYAHKSFVVKYNNIVYHFYCAVSENGRKRGIAVATSEPIGESSLHFLEE